MTLHFNFDADTERLTCMATALNEFITWQGDVTTLVDTLSCQGDYLYTVPAPWRRMFLNMRRSVTLVAAAALRNKHNLSEMELRFILSLCLDMKDMIANLQQERLEPAETASVLALAGD